MSHGQPIGETGTESKVQVTCLCGAICTALASLLSTNTELKLPIPTELCHCDTCRYTSGALSGIFATLGPNAPPEELLTQCVIYASSERVGRYFCRKCGTPVFLRGVSGKDGDIVTWYLWGGVVEASDQVGEMTSTAMQIFAEDTRDAGLLGRQVQVLDQIDSEWKPKFRAGEGGVLPPPLGAVYWGHWNGETLSAAALAENVARLRRDTESRLQATGPTAKADDKLLARCHCGGVEFAVLRPQSAVDMPEKMQAWLRRGDTAYLAKLCVCRSCRLATGHPLQPWTYVPPECIVDVTDGRPIDLGVSEGTLSRLPGVQTYASSEGVRRSFCRTCGATVFFECDDRSWCVDISVGILRSELGALAEDWVEWNWEHVSWLKEGREKTLVTSLTGVV